MKGIKQKMIIGGTRIYSRHEIMRMCQEGFTEQMYEIYARASVATRTIINKYASNEIREELKKRGFSISQTADDEYRYYPISEILFEVEDEDINEIDHIDEEQQTISDVEEYKDIEQDTEEEDIEEIFEDDEDDGEDELFIEPDEDLFIEPDEDFDEDGEDIEESPIKESHKIMSHYKDKIFGTRLNVDELWLTVTENTWCNRHEKKYQSIQVMIKYEQSRNYAATMLCCPECKRLFMCRKEFREYEPIFKKKGILYQVEPEDKY